MTSGVLRPMWLSGVVLGQPLLDMWITCFHPFLHSTRNPKGKSASVCPRFSDVLELCLRIDVSFK